MELHSDIKIIFGYFYGLNDVIVGRSAADDKACVGQSLAVIVVEFITVTVALRNFLFAVGTVHLSAGLHLAGISSEAQRASLCDLVALVGQEVDDLVGRVNVEFAGVGVAHARDIAGEGDDRRLHTEADAEIRQIIDAAVVCRDDLALDASVAEAAGDYNAAAIREDLADILLGDGLGIYPLDADPRAVDVACVAQSLGNGEISVVKLHIFADKADGDGL